MTGEKSMLPSADDVIANAGAFGQQLGLGALAGYVSGRFARAGATVGLALCGGAFVALQTLQYGGYVRVDWHKVEREARRAMDANGDGALTADDAKLAWGEVVDVLAFGVPSGAGFGLGLAHGVGLPGANLLAGGALFAAAPALCGAHLFQTSDGFRETLEKAAPMLSRELTRAVDAAKTRAEAAAGDARWAAAVRAARDDRALRDLAKRTRTEGRRRDKGGRGGLDDARVRSRLGDVEDRRRALRAERRR